MKNLSYLTYFILFNLLLVGQDYLWPTNASETITAFFGEERPRRYHAGIDIRTYGKIGFDLYAIEDGYIEKIKIDYKGYGNTLYLRLNDGNLAVYAHMNRFSPDIDNIISILKQDYNKQVFEHHFEKQEITVKKGDIVGYTGDTGTISGPHLHFEIRDKNNISLNPFVNFYSLEDQIAPIPKKIAIIPQTNQTMIDGYSDIMIYDIKKNNESLNDIEYYISDTISVIGKFGMALNIIDKVDKQPFNYGLYNLELYIDGDLKYKIEYKEHNFSDGHLVLEERNYHLKRTYNETYYNLYNSTPNLSFIDKRSWPFYELNEGIHNIVIKAKDASNNNIIIFGTIISQPNSKILYNINELNDSIIVNIDDRDNNYNYKLDVCNKYDGSSLKTNTTNNKQIAIDKFSFKEPFTVLKMSAKSKNGLNTNDYYYKIKSKNEDAIKGDFIIKSFKHGALIQFKENIFSNNEAKINIIKKDTILSYKTHRITQNVLTTDIINYQNFNGSEKLEIEYHSNPKIHINQNFDFEIFKPNEPLYIKKDNFIINTMQNFITDSMLIWVKINNIVEKPKKAKLLTNAYSIGPKTLIFKKSLNIHFEYEKLNLGVGIYYYDKYKNKWIYLNTKYNNNMYSTSILSNEIFALIEEKNAPIITNLIPDINATYRAKDIENLTFNVQDDLSGISDIKNIEIKIDEELILFEYNPYRKQVSYTFLNRLNKGTHSLEIKVKDNVGNSNLIKGNFIIQ